MLCLISMPAFATDTGDVSVQVTDSDVIVNWTGNIDYQGGACCMYFRCYQDSNLVYSREGVGSYSYQYSYPKGWFSQGDHTFRVEVLLPVNPDIFDSETITIDNTPQMTANPVGAGLLSRKYRHTALHARASPKALWLGHSHL